MLALSQKGRGRKKKKKIKNGNELSLVCADQRGRIIQLFTIAWSLRKTRGESRGDLDGWISLSLSLASSPAIFTFDVWILGCCFVEVRQECTSFIEFFFILCPSFSFTHAHTHTFSIFVKTFIDTVHYPGYICCKHKNTHAHGWDGASDLQCRPVALKVWWLHTWLVLFDTHPAAATDLPVM